MEKGEFSGECNRIACNLGPATYYNYSTRKYYCCKCALMINQANPESLKMYGHSLCTQGKHKEKTLETNDKNNSENNQG